MVGFVKRPVLIVWEWICLRWSMDLQVSRRVTSGVWGVGGVMWVGETEAKEAEDENILIRVKIKGFCFEKFNGIWRM